MTQSTLTPAFRGTKIKEVDVIKWSGEIPEDPERLPEALASVARRLAQGHHVIIVHGGKQAINTALKDAGIVAPFDRTTGLRITPPEAIAPTKQALASLGLKIKNASAAFPAIKAVALGGYDNALITAEINPAIDADGAPHRTGVPVAVKTPALMELLQKGQTPVINPIASGSDGEWNLNGDDAAAAIAQKLAEQEGVKVNLVMCSNVAFVYDQSKNRIGEIYAEDISSLVDNGTLTDGIIPKTKAALSLPSGSSLIICDGDFEGALNGHTGTKVWAPGTARTVSPELQTGKKLTP